MNVYSGMADRPYSIYAVTKNGQTFNPDRSLKVRNHSPTGFAWGYGGSGPAQLALAILLEESNQMTALAKHLDFMGAVIAQLSMDRGWSFTGEAVKRWINGASWEEAIHATREK